MEQDLQEITISESFNFKLIVANNIIIFFSGATASAGGSDDEGSNAATEGSTLRTSPAEPAGSNGSESGGSGVESIGCTSGRSSTYGDQPNSSPPKNELKLQTVTVQEEPEDANETENINKLHLLR